MKFASNAWSLTRETFTEWSQDNVSRLAAALAYYTIFSLAPMLVIMISTVGLVTRRFYAHDPEMARRVVFDQVRDLVGTQGADAIATMVKNAAITGSGWTLVLGIVLLLYGATNVFASLQDSLNTIWEVKPRPGLGIVQTLKNRLLSFAMVLGIAFLLMVSLVISTVLSKLTQYVGGEFPSLFWRVVEQITSLGVFTVIFAAIYKVLPDVKIGWRSVWIGGLLTSVLFTIGKYAIGLYLGRSSTVNVYGAAGSLVVVLLWIYYASQILFFGAEFTQVYARRHGRIKPTEIAVKLTEADRIHQGMPHQQVIDNAVAAADGRRDLPPRRPLIRHSPGLTLTAAAAGLVAGFLAGGSARVIRNRDQSVRDAVSQRMHQRIRDVYDRLRQGERLATYLREADAHDRLDLLQRRVRRASEAARRDLV